MYDGPPPPAGEGRPATAKRLGCTLTTVHKLVKEHGWPSLIGPKAEANRCSCVDQNFFPSSPPVDEYPRLMRCEGCRKTISFAEVFAECKCGEQAPRVAIYSGVDIFKCSCGEQFDGAKQ